MALVPVRTESSFLESEMDGSVESLGRLLDAQKKIFHSQIDQLKRLVVNQCKLTGVNPLSQEMAAGALSIKIGKKPRDLLNPKAVKYMQSIFAIKDTIGKKETREISALCGVTVTQVRDFFSGQRSKVRKLVSLVREKAAKSDASDAANERCSTNPEETLLYHIDAPSSAVNAKNVGDLAEVPDSNGNLLAIQYYQNVPVSSIDSKPIQVVVPSSSSQRPSAAREQKERKGCSAKSGDRRRRVPVTVGDVLVSLGHKEVEGAEEEAAPTSIPTLLRSTSTPQLDQLVLACFRRKQKEMRFSAASRRSKRVGFSTSAGLVKNTCGFPLKSGNDIWDRHIKKRIALTQDLMGAYGTWTADVQSIVLELLLNFNILEARNGGKISCEKICQGSGSLRHLESVNSRKKTKDRAMKGRKERIF
ncbi:hypothetical protein KFK09_000401 [Dendrobium nobile]|uniref:Homeobox domain-containing protein n=1 Tax=Dendrobium nobile TaxID=94219 RepID=A0A8T3CEL2_DENNO|nr:hypothetical protein KFK09_000401 [Dendrobium nobile]